MRPISPMRLTALKCHRLLFFGENSLKRSCFNSFILKQALKWAWSACLGVERLFGRGAPVWAWSACLGVERLFGRGAPV
jgi:hypothetical protein